MTILEKVRSVIEDQIREGYSKFIIYPYGIAGYMVREVLRKEFCIEPIMVIDNRKYATYDFVEDIRILQSISLEDVCILVGTHNMNVFRGVMDSLESYQDKCKVVDVFPLLVGKHTWGGQLLTEGNGYLIESIGAFCSLAEGVCVVANHNMQGVSTSAYFQGINLDESKELQEGIDHYQKLNFLNNERSKIGNDVWLGRNVIICNGAKIGDGVIGCAGAVITKDVPDYAIVGGVPAKIIKYRYSPSQIAMLKSIEWWNWSDEKIAGKYEEFQDIDLFLEKNYSGR